MADQKITQLNNTNTMSNDMLVPTVVDPAGTPVTEKRTVGEMRNHIIAPTVTSEVSSATPTIQLATGVPHRHRITALAANITSFTTNLSGTPAPLQQLIIEVTPTATRTVTWGTAFESGAVHTLPTTFTGTATVLLGFMWNAATSKFRLVALDA